MITGAAFVPSTPLLVPRVAQGAAGELDGLRTASLDAVRAVLETPAQRLVVVGAGTSSWLRLTGTASFRGFGVGLDLPLDPAAPGGEPLPLPLSIGAWLLAQVGWPGERAAQSVDAAASDAELDAIGASLAAADVPTALLVVADGSAARDEKAPAHLHPGAAAFDRGVAAALSAGDPAALAALDRAEAQAVTAAGRPAWRTAAAALAGATWDATLRNDTAPYGVGYLIATWVHP